MPNVYELAGRSMIGTADLDDLRRIVAHLPKRTIIGEGGPYLTRYKLFGSAALPGDDRDVPCSVYIHQFHTPDQDRALHSHPWVWSQSLVLAGGYTERRSRVRIAKTEAAATTEAATTVGLEPVEVCFYGPGQRNLFVRGDYHTIDTLHGETWTLFQAGPAIESWGFWDDERGHVPWRQYLAERGLSNGAD